MKILRMYNHIKKLNEVVAGDVYSGVVNQKT